MKFFFLVLFMRFSQVLTKQWVDPHDMNTNAKENLIKSSLRDDSTEELIKRNCNCSDSRVEDNVSFVYLKRVVSLLISAATVDKNNVELRNGKYILDTVNEDFNFLREFTTSKEVNVQKLRKLDAILSGIFQKHVSDDVFDTILTTQEKLMNLLFDVKMLVFSGISVALYIMYHLFQTKHSFWYILCYFLMIILIVDYGLKYQTSYNEAEEQNVKVLSKECREMSSWQYWFSGKSKDCEKKVVNPLEVLLLQVKQVIIIPLSALGTGLGQFTHELWKNLPFPWNILIFPIMLVFVLIIFLILRITQNDKSFKLNIMHLLHLESGGPVAVTNIRNRQLAGENHRLMLENTRSSPEYKNSKKSIKEKKKTSKQDNKTSHKENSKSQEKKAICECKNNLNKSGSSSSSGEAKSSMNKNVVNSDFDGASENLN